MIGVIIATSAEAAPLLARAGIIRPWRDLARRRARGRAQDVPALYDLRPARQAAICVCGMGPAKARAGVDALLNEYAVAAVVNAGVAGALGAGKAVGGIFRISEAWLWPDMETRYACRGDRWTDLPSAVLATVAQPVFDPARRGAIARWADIVDMEGAAIAQGCASRGVPLYALKGVTDLAGKRGRERLMANLDRISMTVAEIVWRELVV